MQPAIAAAGLLVGLVIGLTGMGGGALMTPILVLFFHVSPAAAIRSERPADGLENGPGRDRRSSSRLLLRPRRRQTVETC